MSKRYSITETPFKRWPTFPHHIETSVYIVNHLTGFFMMGTLTLIWLAEPFSIRGKSGFENFCATLKCHKKFGITKLSTL